MTYYILLKGEPKEALMFDAAILGEMTSDGKKFYTHGGFKRLLKIADKKPELLESCTCYDDTNRVLTVEQFLKAIDKCTIKQHMEE